MSDLVGQAVGRYHVIEQLGQGGMATVYRAYDTRLKREIAIKVIRRDQVDAERSAQLFKRFEREAVSLAKLTHPNIVSVYDYGEFQGAPYLVMEYVEGGTLRNRLGQRYAWRDASRLLAPIARALDYAHQHKLVHRDVKPANILVTPGGVPKLSDFGIAKILEPGEMGLTGTGVGIGTPEYMAPEQGSGAPIDHRADIYSLGVVFYELVTGRKPYTADTPIAVLVKQMNDPLPRPKNFVEIPDEVERVLFTALAKKPEDRYQSMGDFANALEKLAAGELTATPTGMVSRQDASTLVQPAGALSAGPGTVPGTATSVMPSGTASAPDGAMPSSASVQYNLPPATQNLGGGQQPPYGAQGAQGYAAPQKKSKGWLIALGVAAGLFACIVLGAGGFYLYSQAQEQARQKTATAVAQITSEARATERSAQKTQDAEIQMTQDAEDATATAIALNATATAQMFALQATQTAQYTGGSFLLVNNSNVTICYFYISPDTSSEWGSDWLGSDTVAAGSSYTVYNVPANVYDLKAEDCSHNIIESIDALDVPTYNSWTVTGTGISGTGGNIAVTLYNNASSTVCYVRYKPAGDASWAGDLLGSSTLSSGSSFVAYLNSGYYDLQAEDCNNTVFQFESNVSVFSNTSWNIYDNSGSNNGSSGTLVIYNNNSTTVCYVYYSDPGSSSWTGDLLGSSTLSSYSSFTAYLNQGYYDLQAEDCSHNVMNSITNYYVGSYTEWSVP
jgi:tRNA A-37 threonylcarbamoyl transferase component Bud32